MQQREVAKPRGKSAPMPASPKPKRLDQAESRRRIHTVQGDYRCREDIVRRLSERSNKWPRGGGTPLVTICHKSRTGRNGPRHNIHRILHRVWHGYRCGGSASDNGMGSNGGPSPWWGPVGGRFQQKLTCLSLFSPVEPGTSSTIGLERQGKLVWREGMGKGRPCPPQTPNTKPREGGGTFCSHQRSHHNTRPLSASVQGRWWWCVVACHHGWHIL